MTQFFDERLPMHFWDKVQPCPMSGCWFWVGCIDQGGYGQIGGHRGGKRWSARAHRHAYEALVSSCPVGLELDHLCRVTGCVNPDHLEPVTHRVNVLRGGVVLRKERASHCKVGHPFDKENTVRYSKYRICRKCQRENKRRFMSKLRDRSES